MTTSVSDGNRYSPMTSGMLNGVNDTTAPGINNASNAGSTANMGITQTTTAATTAADQTNNGISAANQWSNGTGAANQSSNGTAAVQNGRWNSSGNQTTGTASRCSDNEGVLPACAPLAVPYVPFQQTGSKRYNHTEALNNGTLFPSLNLPFHVKVKGSDIVSSAMAELQALSFVVQELALYLDTHPDDTEAFGLFQQYVAMSNEGRDRYEKMYGPISRNSTANDTEYTWVDNPWPWDYQEGN